MHAVGVARTVPSRYFESVCGYTCPTSAARTGTATRVVARRSHTADLLALEMNMNFDVCRVTHAQYYVYDKRGG